MVQQEVYLFSGTVYENIAYGKEDATKEEIRDAFIEFTAKPFTIFWALETFGFVLGSIVGVILIIFATALGFFTSVVIYPYAIVQNIKYS